MIEQPTLFGEGQEREHAAPALDREAARDARDRAIVRVDEHAAELWRENARQLLERLCYEREEITSDDLWQAGLEGTRENRALGPVFLWAARRGLIAKTGRVRNTAQIASHASPMTIWRSLVYRQEARA